MRSGLLRRVWQRRWVVTMGGATVLAAGLSAAAAIAIGPLRADAQDNANQQQTVYVRDSAIAADKFELAKRMERLKEWPKSADVYQEIIEKYKDRMVLTRSDQAGRPLAYQSITIAVQERLARWPEEGVAVYRGRFEPQAASMLATVGRGDVETLHRIFNQYFITDAAREAGMRLMDLALEGGEFPEATWIGDRLLQWHPNLTAQRPAVLFRTATAYHLAGDTASARKRLEELKKNHAGTQVIVAGRETNIVEALEKQLAQAPPTANAAHGNTSWRTFGGDETRNLVFDAAAEPADRIYSIPIAGIDVESIPPAHKASFTMNLRNAREQGLTVNVIPAVDAGELFFQDGMRLYAVHLESGVPLPGWLQTYAGHGQFRVESARRGEGQQAQAAAVRVDAWTQQAILAPRQHTVTLTDDAVLAVMGQPAVRAGSTIGPGTQLICLDRATGMLRWSADPRNLPNNPGNARNISFSGSPLVVGDNVYVIARGSSGAGAEDCSVFCYALESGSLKWTSYIASSQTGPVNMFGGGGVAAGGGDSASHLSFSSGRVYVQTNLGAIAAIDAYSGDTAWLTLYPRNMSQVFRPRRIGVMPQQQLGERAKPWHFNSVLVHEGKLFTLPADGEHLIIYDAGSGQEVKRISNKIELPSGTHELTMLLGVIDNMLIVAGDSSVLMLDWTVLEQRRADSNRINHDDSLLYLMPLDTIWGRPFVARDQMLVPTRARGKESVRFFDMKKLRVTAAYPGDGQWASAEEGLGNIIAVQSHVIIANASSVSVYTDIKQVRQRYQMAIQSDPTNLDARLVFSELMFNARKTAEAIEALNEAVTVLGGREQMRPGTARDRVFSDAIMFAQRLAAAKKPDAIQRAVEMFDLAAAAAHSPAQQVSYRMARSKFLEEQGQGDEAPDYARAVALHQEILLDGSMRAVRLAGEDGGFWLAGKAAEDAIDRITKRFGSRFYEPFAKEAAAKLDELSQKPEPAALLALAEQYPNAVNTATSAMMKAAQAMEDQGNPRLAGQVLRQLHWKYASRLTDVQQRASTEALARVLLKVENVGAAAGRLQRVAASSPDARLSAPLTLSNGKALLGADGKPVATFKAAAEALQGLVLQRQSLPLARFQLPVPTVEEQLQEKPWPKPFVQPAGEAIINNVQALVPAPFDGGWRADRVVAWSDGKLTCFAPGKPQPLWGSAAAGEAPAGLHWLDNKLLAWGGGEVNLIDGQSGARLWKSQVSTLPAADVFSGAAADDGPIAGLGAEMEIRQEVIGGRIVRFGGAVAVNAAVAPMPAPGGVPAQLAAAEPAREQVMQVVPLSGSVIYSTNAGRIVAVDLEQGRVLWQGRLGNGVALHQMVATEDFVAARFQAETIARIIVLDTYNGQMVHRRAFSAASAAAPVNCALSPDGTLIWTTTGAIAAKDLYEAGDAPTWERPGRSYAGMTLPDQLVVLGNDVLALCQNGTYIDRRKLRNGDPIGNPLSTGAADKEQSPRMRIDGARIYVAGRRSLVTYHLEQDTSCPMHAYPGVEYLPGDVMLTAGYTVMPGMVKEADNDHTFTLQFYSRALNRTRSGAMVESGRGEHRWDFSEPERVRSWQAVDGGIYYLTGDDRLVWLKAMER